MKPRGAVARGPWWRRDSESWHGDRRDFRGFFAQHYERLCRLGFLLTGDPGQAEDLAQDALVRTWRRWRLVLGIPAGTVKTLTRRGLARQGCPPGQPVRIRPAVGLAHWFPDPSAVPTDPDGLLAAIYRLVEDPACAPILVGDTVQDRAFMLIDGMLQTVMPAEVRAALYQALPKIPGVTVVQGATDAAGRRGVAFTLAAAIEGTGSSGWLRLEIILDPDTHRYLGARRVVTRDHFTPDTPSGSKGTGNHKGQVLVSRAQVALAIVDAPCQRPGETTTCASYAEDTWVVGRSSRG